MSAAIKTIGIRGHTSLRIGYLYFRFFRRTTVHRFDNLRQSGKDIRIYNIIEMHNITARGIRNSNGIAASGQANEFICGLGSNPIINTIIEWSDPA